MKTYELPWQQTIPAKSYTIIRVDGRAFHTLTRHMDKPFDPLFMVGMDWVGQFLCEEIQGAQFAYIQSDEVSVLITDFEANQGQWFGGAVQKMASVSASVATLAWLGYMHGHAATFDARVFTVPNRLEAINYFLWRQADCHRNAISMIAESKFSSKALLGKKSPERIQMLAEAGVDVNDFPVEALRGRVVVSVTFPDTVTYTRKDTGQQITEDFTRTRWEPHPAPWFDWDEAGFLETHIPHRKGLPDELPDQ